MSKEVLKQSVLQGPSITGTVTVSLIELDNLRANHAADREKDKKGFWSFLG